MKKNLISTCSVFLLAAFALSAQGPRGGGPMGGPMGGGRGMGMMGGPQALVTGASLLGARSGADAGNAGGWQQHHEQAPDYGVS